MCSQLEDPESSLTGPFYCVITKGGLHIYHLFWGILLLMVTGFFALATRDP